MIRVLITGSRTWTDYSSIARVLSDTVEKLKHWKKETDDDPVTLVSGSCPDGADAMCEKYAKSRGWAVEMHPANWRPNGVYDRGAGFARNKLMVDLGADALVAFIHNDSNGASHTVRCAKAAKMPVREERAYG